MKVVNIYKAQKTVERVESVKIVIETTIPVFKTLGEQDAVSDKDAMTLEDSLYRSLPGAIYDRLLGHMLTRSASHFRVTHEAK